MNQVAQSLFLIQEAFPASCADYNLVTLYFYTYILYIEVNLSSGKYMGDNNVIIYSNTWLLQSGLINWASMNVTVFRVKM